MDISSPLAAILLAFVRIVSFLYVIPLFKGSYVPNTAKFGISLSLAIYMQDKIQIGNVENLPTFIALLLIQLLIGLTLGFVVNMIFAIPQIAGSLLDIDMGYSSSMIIDPMNGVRASLLSNFYSILFMIMFVMLGGINNIIYDIMLSFQFTKVIMFANHLSFLNTLIGVFQYMLTAGIQIALPIVGSMFMINILLLILGKVAPQLNIFTNMYPVKVAIGILFIYFTLPITGDLFSNITDNLNTHYSDMLQTMLSK